MIRRFDHVAIAVRDLAAARAAYERAGFTVSTGGRHTGRGTENALVRFGTDYLELITVFDAEQARHASDNGRFLVRFLAEREGGAIALSLASARIEEEAQRLERAGVEALGPFSADRLRPDGKRLSWRLVLIGGTAMGRLWPTIIEWDHSDDALLALEPPPQHPNGACRVAGVKMVTRDLTEGRRIYESLLGLPPPEPRAYPSLGARGMRYDLAGVVIDVVTPTGPGAASTALERPTEGLFQVDIEVRSREHARSVVGAGTEFEEGVLILPERLFDTRIVLLPRQSRTPA